MEDVSRMQQSHLCRRFIYLDCAHVIKENKSMPDLNRNVFGEAFKLPSRNFDYYRDMFLMWPVWLFSLGSIIDIITPKSPEYRVYGLKLAACAIVAVVLAKERLILLAGGAGFVAIRLAIALAVTQDWKSYVLALLVSAGIVLAVLRVRRDWKPRYASPAKTNALGILVGAVGLGSAVAIAFWLKP
jgi:hypothetical protein